MQCATSLVWWWISIFPEDKVGGVKGEGLTRKPPKLLVACD